jgi:hypothetical protein
MNHQKKYPTTKFTYFSGDITPKSFSYLFFIRPSLVRSFGKFFGISFILSSLLGGIYSSNGYAHDGSFNSLVEKHSAQEVGSSDRSAVVVSSPSGPQKVGKSTPTSSGQMIYPEDTNYIQEINKESWASTDPTAVKQENAQENDGQGEEDQKKESLMKQWIENARHDLESNNGETVFPNGNPMEALQEKLRHDKGENRPDVQDFSEVDFVEFYKKHYAS